MLITTKQKYKKGVAIHEYYNIRSKVSSTCIKIFFSLIRVVNKWVKFEIKKRTAMKLMPYERAAYPDQKVQIDVKFVPSYCVSNGQKYYQYTAIDERTMILSRCDVTVLK